MIGIKTQHNEGDLHLVKALGEIHLDGDYRFGFELKDGRSQMGWRIRFLSSWRNPTLYSTRIKPVAEAPPNESACCRIEAERESI